MKTAHQGVALSALPGFAGGAWMSSAPSAPPPNVNGAGGAVGGGRPSPSEGGGLDSWLLDKLFGRR